MSDKSAIQWTDATWNPVTGCSKISPGCANCYAEKISLRFGHSSKPWTPEHAGENVVLHPERLDQPLRWRRPRMVFVNSMSDLFHEEIPYAYIRQVVEIMARAQQHTFQVLTKRPERALEFWRKRWSALSALTGNVWMGVSIENSRFTWRADVLREIPMAVRFISAEPLLGSLMGRGPHFHHANDETRLCTSPTCQGGDSDLQPRRHPLDLAGIDWVIVGGESGPGAREMRLEWCDELIANCREFGVAPFVKQLGSVWARHARAEYGFPVDPKGGNPDYWPERLRIREMPEVRSASR